MLGAGMPLLPMPGIATRYMPTLQPHPTSLRSTVMLMVLPRSGTLVVDVGSHCCVHWPRYPRLSCWNATDVDDDCFTPMPPWST